MILATELINDNGISGFALAFFTALFAAIGTTIVQVFKLRTETREAKEVSKKVQKETSSLNNGLGTQLNRKLDLLAVNHDRLESIADQISDDLRKHIIWHLEQEGKKHA
jgi:hypothetical protein